MTKKNNKKKILKKYILNTKFAKILMDFYNSFSTRKYRKRNNINRFSSNYYKHIGDAQKLLEIDFRTIMQKNEGLL